MSKYHEYQARIKYLEELLPLYEAIITSYPLELAIQILVGGMVACKVHFLQTGCHSWDEVQLHDTAKIFVTELREHLPEMAHLVRSKGRHPSSY